MRFVILLLGAVAVAASLVYFEPWPKPPIGAIVTADDAQGRWPVFGGTTGGTRFSALNQINRGNVKALQVAWSYSTGEYKEAGADNAAMFSSFQATPILIADSLIGCTHRHRVFALDPGTGKVKWRFDPKLTPTPRGDSMLKCRGVAAFEDPALSRGAPCKTSIILGASMQVFAIDARTGKLCPSFGRKGVVDVPSPGVEAKDEVELRSPPAIVGDVAVFGSTLFDIYRTNSPSGKVRAFDVRTGALRWDYDPIPREKSDPAYESWGNGSADYVGSANVWSFISADPVNNLVFLPTTAPAADFWGVHRPGDNRWSSSLVALDATTGKQVWAFQLAHHDIFDQDLPAMPILVDLTVKGVKVPAVVQLTKRGQVFVFNRLTGVPVHPITERPVPQYTDVPGETVSPTQPFQDVIPPLVKAGLKPEDAWGFTPYDRAKCRDLIAGYRSDGLFTPPTRQGTIFMPAGAGGNNWGGAAVDPRSGVMYIPTLAMPQLIKLVQRKGAGTPRRPGQGAEEGLFPMKGSPYQAELSWLVSPFGAPCSAPPWATFSAVDLATGKLLWTKTLGTISNLARFAPPLPLGAPWSGGPIVTAGGVSFMAGTTDQQFRAFDTETGETLWSDTLPAGGMAVPMTYSWHGRQFVVIAAGGNNLFPGPMGDTMVAYALKPGWRW
ncbi:MAG: pyrroloquinoline quinone-dependent dehydrogenase [Beijerinckiaceae bacterium]|nr:pyrroloquinoline quinone-dependent dehydrogenase [Beijerinckiaceae bacterium]